MGDEMKQREEAARFVERQLFGDADTKRDKNRRHHYGVQELRDLMDFIYGGEPEADGHKIRTQSYNPFTKTYEFVESQHKSKR